MKNYTLLATLLWLFFSVQTMAQPVPPKREFRGVWVATVANIDYPKAPDQRSVALKEQWIQLVEMYKNMGLNAVIVQVRPAGDAIYPTEMAPWSKYLTGRQGLPPADTTFDPLAFMIEEAHRNGMEFHAWFNPYRATMDLDTLSLSSMHLFNKRRDWMLRYGNRFLLNPALPEVREHIAQVVGKVVQKYDVDAVHFDDYFYPYKVAGEVFPDSLEYLVLGKSFANIDDWRRSNVDALVQLVSEKIRDTKPHVQFGISPFGVWRNRDKDPVMGSDTRAGLTSYDDLYADVLKWSRLGWIDYVAPQLYWHIGFTPADHYTLLKWWERNAYGRLLHIGHGAYKVANNQEVAWYDPAEMSRQIDLNRRNLTASGSIYFSSKSLVNNPLGVRDSISHYYARPSLLPIPPDKAQKAFEAPQLLQVKSKNIQPLLRWRPNRLDRKNPPLYYVVYRFEGNTFGDFENARYIMTITPRGLTQKTFEFHDATVLPDKTYTYTVTAFNRTHVESKAAPGRTVYIGQFKVQRK
ncbi:MAG: family 10 glycosylhydrolase [Saprospiraceae bacterium]|nr:family 10 glycosylhydrolase [Saprospiraceae bacterium]